MIRRPLIATLLVVAAAAATLVPGTPSIALAGTTTVLASADSYVQADQPAVNFGTSTELHPDASPVTNAYLKFGVSGLTSPPGKVTLKIFSRSTGSTTIKIQSVADSTWTETGITYANAPAAGATLGNSGALTVGAYFSLDVTAAVTTNGTYSFMASTGSTAVRILDSRQGANPPQLVIDPGPPPSTDPVLLAAGDVACAPDDPGYNGGLGVTGACHMKATSDILVATPAAVVAELGDMQYDSAAPAAIQASYAPTWGRVKSITKPVVGNHEYGQTGASSYFGYFGDAATPLEPGCVKNCKGYYSYEIGAWHIAVINSECQRIDSGVGCAVGSLQQQWLDADLAAHPTACTMVIGHEPRWVSNSSASSDIAPLIDIMYARRVDIYLAGHSHNYERFAPQNPAGQRDDAAGVRQFVVGTGGENSSGFLTPVANSEVRKNNIFGIEKLTLHPGSYDYSYLPDPTTPFADNGTGTCH